MSEMKYITVIGLSPGPKMEIVNISEVEPSDVDLKKIWNNRSLKNHGDISDLIEVYEMSQVESAFNIRKKELELGKTLIPNNLSEERWLRSIILSLTNIKIR